MYKQKQFQSTKAMLIELTLNITKKENKNGVSREPDDVDGNNESTISFTCLVPCST